MKIFTILVRIYLHPEQLEEGIIFYEQILGEKSRVRFKYPERNLELAQVGSFLLIAGSESALEPFKATTATFQVDSLEEYRETLLKNGAVILNEPQPVPTGRNMLARHPDGTCIEYVQHAVGQMKTVDIA